MTDQGTDQIVLSQGVAWLLGIAMGVLALAALIEGFVVVSFHNQLEAWGAYRRLVESDAAGVQFIEYPITPGSDEQHKLACPNSPKLAEFALGILADPDRTEAEKRRVREALQRAAAHPGMAVYVHVRSARLP